MAGRRASSARRPARRSQHFLRSAGLAAELVRDAEIGPGDLVLDIGAGRGRLTEQLARVGGHVVAVEIDKELALGLRGRWENVDVVAGDITAVELPREPFRVVANIPFHHTTDVMHLLLDDPSGGLTRADLIVQWDVAVRRALPWPSSVNGVVWGAFWDMTVARRLPRSAFALPPAVDAALLVLSRKSSPLVDARSAAEYRRFVAAGFRKGVRHVARSRSSAIPPRGRIARDLDAHEWAALFRGGR